MRYKGKHLKGSTKHPVKRKGKPGESVVTVGRPPTVNSIIEEVKSWRD